MKIYLNLSCKVLSLTGIPVHPYNSLSDSLFIFWSMAFESCSVVQSLHFEQATLQSLT